jgi:ribosomal protein S18 acetylase RimI-like enzyme
MSQFTYQLARASDADTISHLSRTLIEDGLHPSWSAQRVRWHIRHRESVVLTARAGTVLAGFAIMEFHDTDAHLNLLGVLPCYQRRGVGRGLMGWLEASAVTAGTFFIKLEVRAGNAVGRAFYSGLGYREDGQVPGYYQGRETAIRMSRDLRLNCTSFER